MRGFFSALAPLCLLLSGAAHADDTWESGSLAPPTSLLEYTSELLTLCRPRNIEIVSGRPIPTNTWWGNLVSCDNTTDPTTVWAQPLAVIVDSAPASGSLYGFGLTYPYRNRFFGNFTSEGVTQFYAHAVRKEFVVSALEFVTEAPTTRVVNWTDLGVTVRMSVPSTTKVLETSMVSGMAYFTSTFTALTPRFTIEEPLSTINGVTVTTGTIVSGSRFVLVTVTGKSWILYTQSATTGAASTVLLKADSNMVLRTVFAFNGVLRVSAVADSTQSAAHDAYRGCVVSGGTVSITSNSAYQFQWQTSGNCSKGLFHYALDHHVRTVSASSVVMASGVTMYSTTRGPMSALITRTSPPVWTLTEPNTIPVTFYPRKRPTTAEMSSLSMLTRLITDVQSAWGIATTGSYYFNGKMAQKYATLCLMANDPTIVGTDTSVLKRCVSKLEAALEQYLTNGWTYKLKYDSALGGVITSQSFVTRDITSDFGNALYNDHHYHYGYWVYAAAVLNYLHPTWSRIGELNAMTTLLLRDVATPNSADKYFPKFRSFDWYRGHSYSHGLTMFADGKDEESTSEDINFVYAMSLYGMATGHVRMQAIGNLMTKLTARAIQTYFLMASTSNIHPPSFRPHMVPGILFDNKADYATWFCASEECIHGIQMLPVSPVTEYSRPLTFVKEEWSSILAKLDAVVNKQYSNAWLSLLYVNYARLDKAGALPVLQQVTLDDGLSRSWALYTASTFSQ
jgi:endo-1,3(4)-beta-glucanase